MVFQLCISSDLLNLTKFFEGMVQTVLALFDFGLTDVNAKKHTSKVFLHYLLNEH